MPAKKKIFTQEETLAIIKKLEQGECPASIARSYSVNESSICTIRKNADKIKETISEATPVSAKSTSNVQNPLLEKMEKMLSVWLEDQNQKRIPINSFIIQEKALQLYQHLEQNTGSSSTIEPFHASKGWLDRFRKQRNLRSMKRKPAGPSSLGKSEIPAGWSAKDFGEEAVETNLSMTQGLCEAYPPPAQDPQDSSDVYTMDSSSIMDGGSVAEEAEFPMTLKTQAKSPSPTQDPLQPSELYTIDGSGGNVAEEAEFPMTLETLAKSPSPTQDPLQPKQIQMQHKNHFTNVMEALACDEAFVDVTLTAEGRAIRAHKLVLSAVSPYFQQVLRDNPCRHPIIVMPYHVQFDHLTHIVEYVYKGEITIAEDQVEPVLKTAKLLQVTGLAASDSADLISENGLCTAPEMNHPPMRSSIMTNQSCSSGGTLPLISTSKVTVLEGGSHKVSKPFYRSSITVRSPTGSVATPSENTSTQVNICKRANTLVSSRAVDSETLRGSTSSTFTRISGVPVNISRPVSAELSINDSPILEGLSDTEIDFVKEEEDLTEDKEENVELIMVDYTPQEASRRDPLRTYQKPRKSHTALPNRDILPDNTNLSTPDPFICPYCEEQHLDINKMKAHLNRKHPFKPKFICGCGRIFVRPIQHQVHTKSCPSSS